LGCAIVDCGSVTPAVAAENYYVASDVLNVRLCPATTCPITNRIYRQQKVEVFEIRGEWARITEYYDAASERLEFPQLSEETVARWVIQRALSKSRLTDVEFKRAEELDPRVQGIPKAGENGISAQESELMGKYANQLVRTDQCRGVVFADRSVNRANQYYVQCTGENGNRYFTAEDVK
jgi:hypothetical protein